jgi:hypothetical protein
MRSLVVFGGRVSDTNRRIVEDGFVAALTKHGVRAIPSYTLLPQLPSKDEARAALKQVGTDGFLVATLRGIHEQTTIYGGGGYNGGFWGGYYGTGWAGAPTQITTDQYVNFETSLWDGQGDGKLVWSALTETSNPSSRADFMSSLLNKVIPALTQAGLLPPEQGNAVSYAPVLVRQQ